MAPCNFFWPLVIANWCFYLSKKKKKSSQKKEEVVISVVYGRVGGGKCGRKIETEKEKV